jgi:hypothetical protein
LDSALHFPANPYKETERCRGAAAYTHVGGPATRVCQRFAAMSDEAAAAVLIHEALHHAGLGELPCYQDAGTSADIDHSVRRHCGF